MNLAYVLSDLLNNFFGKERISRVNINRKRRPFDLSYKEELMDKKKKVVRRRNFR